MGCVRPSRPTVVRWGTGAFGPSGSRGRRPAYPRRPDGRLMGDPRRPAPGEGGETVTNRTATPHPRPQAVRGRDPARRPRRRARRECVGRARERDGRGRQCAPGRRQRRGRRGDRASLCGVVLAPRHAAADGHGGRPGHVDHCNGLVQSASREWMRSERDDDDILNAQALIARSSTSRDKAIASSTPFATATRRPHLGSSSARFSSRRRRAMRFARQGRPPRGRPDACGIRPSGRSDRFCRAVQRDHLTSHVLEARRGARSRWLRRASSVSVSCMHSSSSARCSIRPGATRRSRPSWISSLATSWTSGPP